jgi:hypothetical protein
MILVFLDCQDGRFCSEEGYRAHWSQTKRQPHSKGDHEEGALSSLRLGTQALLAFRIPSVDMEEVNRLRTGCIASFMLRWPASANAPAEACDLS